jgi:hypothetical protein
MNTTKKTLRVLKPILIFYYDSDSVKPTFPENISDYLCGDCLVKIKCHKSSKIDECVCCLQINNPCKGSHKIIDDRLHDLDQMFSIYRADYIDRKVYSITSLGKG